MGRARCPAPRNWPCGSGAKHTEACISPARTSAGMDRAGLEPSPCFRFWAPRWRRRARTGSIEREARTSPRSPEPWQRPNVENSRDECAISSLGFSDKMRHVLSRILKICTGALPPTWTASSKGAKPGNLPVEQRTKVAHHQPQDREGARSDHPAVAPGAGGRGHSGRVRLGLCPNCAQLGRIRDHSSTLPRTRPSEASCSTSNSYA